MGWQGHILLGQNYFQWNLDHCWWTPFQASRRCEHKGQQCLSAPPTPPWELPAAHNVGPKICPRAVIDSDLIPKPGVKASGQQAGKWTLPLEQRNREILFELSKFLSVSHHGICQNTRVFLCWISRPCFILAVILYELLHFYQLFFLGFESQKKKKGLSHPIDNETKLCEPTKTAEAKSITNRFKRKVNAFMEKELVGEDGGKMGKPSSKKLWEI